MSFPTGVVHGLPHDKSVSAARPVAWCWTRNQIGRDLRELDDVAKDLPPELLTLVRKLDDRGLFPSVGSQNDRDFFP